MTSTTPGGFLALFLVVLATTLGIMFLISAETNTDTTTGLAILVAAGCWAVLSRLAHLREQRRDTERLRHYEEWKRGRSAGEGGT